MPITARQGPGPDPCKNAEFLGSLESRDHTYKRAHLHFSSLILAIICLNFEPNSNVATKTKSPMSTTSSCLGLSQGNLSLSREEGAMNCCGREYAESISPDEYSYR